MSLLNMLIYYLDVDLLNIVITFNILVYWFCNLCHFSVCFCRLIFPLPWAIVYLPVLTPTTSLHTGIWKIRLSFSFFPFSLGSLVRPVVNVWKPFFIYFVSFFKVVSWRRLNLTPIFFIFAPNHNFCIIFFFCIVHCSESRILSPSYLKTFGNNVLPSKLLILSRVYDSSHYGSFHTHFWLLIVPTPPPTHIGTL